MHLLPALVALIAPIFGYLLVYLTKDETKAGKIFLQAAAVVLLFIGLLVQVVYFAQTMDVAYAVGALFVLATILCYHYLASKQYALLSLTGAMLVSSQMHASLFIMIVLVSCINLIIPALLQADKKGFNFKEVQVEYVKNYATSFIVFVIVGVVML